MALITYLTTIHFDHGALGLAAGECRRLGIARPLVVTDAGLAAGPLLDALHRALDGIATTVFAQTPSNPDEASALAALTRYRESRCDGVVAFGGGSSMDLGKAVALLATHPLPLAQYALIEGGLPRIGPHVAPLVAIPTTAGTGSEVGRAAVIVLADGRKVGIVSPHMLPKVAICDPDLTLGLPPSLTAATGMDAVAHCIETFLAPAVNPPAEAIALDGLARAAAHLERAVRDGSDRAARWNMMMAAMEGAMAFQKGLGAVHALSHPLGALPQKLHHGTLNAVLLPEVLHFNAGHVGDKLTRLAQAMGLAPGAEVAAEIAALNARIGLPGGLGAMGTPREALPAIAAAAMRDHCHATNPRPATAADYLGILQRSW
jgi:alcohol dehydrogenase class IV